jgi:hypothetical protein
VAAARLREASTFSFRVPSGSASHLSGKRFAAPDCSNFVRVDIWLGVAGDEAHNVRLHLAYECP